MTTPHDVVDVAAYYNELEDISDLDEFVDNPEPRCPAYC